MSLERSTIKLTDVYEVAMLMQQGHSYESYVVEGNKVRFTFSSAVEEVLKQFYEGHLIGNLQEYKHKLHDLRALIFAVKGGPAGSRRG